MTRPLIIVGSAGMARDAAWLADRTGIWELVAFVEDSPRAPLLNDVPVLTFEAAVKRHPQAQVVTAVGSPAVRKMLRERALEMGFAEATLVDPDARIAHRVVLGPGSVVCAGATISVDSQIGAAALVNMNSTVGHDALWDDYVTVSPGVNIAGWVAVGEGAFMGIGSQIIEGKDGAPLVIGAWSTVAGGACVIRAVEARTMVAGVPARPKG